MAAVTTTTRIAKLTAKYRIDGFVAAGFETIASMFEQSFARGREENAQCCVYVGDEVVVDLYGVTSKNKPTTAKEYTADSLQNCFSATKSLTAIAMACLVDRGLLSYEERVATYWPEFAQNGKGEVKVKDVLRHESGLSAFTKTLSIGNVQRDSILRNEVGSVIEAEPQIFPPVELGVTKRQYHAYTRGWICNEIFRRVEPDGRTIGQFLRSQMFESSLEADVHIGLPENELHKSHDLTAESVVYTCAQSFLPKRMGRTTELSIGDYVKMARTVKLPKNKPCAPLDIIKQQFNLPRLYTSFNDPRMKTGESPSVNGQCSARGLAKVAAVMANKGSLGDFHLMSEASWDSMHAEPKNDIDSNFFEVAFSQGGVAEFSQFGKQFSDYMGGINYRSGYWGWMGFGGPILQWHPALKIGFGYANTMVAWYDLFNTRAAMLQLEVVKCVQERENWDSGPNT